ncbi:hypothetical protein CK500_02535 [Halorubrum salipaludis]|uniref:Uncharacterized protein n=1 Tax=Halorubrum salipaludis TaxID=2032630 RepID=A0A2A2FLY4_9EURY|nr:MULTISPECIES: hypothetical protein [Halorubrum]PAU85565.1 hypothetical protein CK500_02535 [Halorubrum salipaludis]
MIRRWIRSLSRAGALVGALLIGVAVASTLFMVLSAADVVDEVVLLVVLGVGSATVATGAAVYGYMQTDGE